MRRPGCSEEVDLPTFLRQLPLNTQHVLLSSGPIAGDNAPLLPSCTPSASSKSCPNLIWVCLNVGIPVYRIPQSCNLDGEHDIQRNHQIWGCPSFRQTRLCLFQTSHIAAQDLLVLVNGTHFFVGKFPKSKGPDFQLGPSENRFDAYPGSLNP